MFERSRTKVRFSNEDMDYLFQVVLGYHTYGGASFGELFRAASKVEDGNPESWIVAFREMGSRLERQAAELEEEGRASSAPAFLRAFTGYRAAAFLMNPKTDFERFSETVESFVRCFRKAIPSFGHPCDPIRVPFEDDYMSGYFYRADDRNAARQTLISGGGYAVTRAAAAEKRLRAAVADTPIYDIYRLITEAVPAFLLDETHSGVSRWLLEVSGRFNKAGRNNMDKFAWQSGKGSLLEALQVTKGEPVDVGAIECPMLCLAGDGDPPDALVQTREVYDRLTDPRKSIRILTAEEGAEAHTHVNNFPLLHQVIFDWLDEVFV